LDAGDATALQKNFKDKLTDCGVDQCELIGLQRVRSAPTRRRAVKRVLSDAQMVGAELRLANEFLDVAVRSGADADASARRALELTAPPTVAVLASPPPTPAKSSAPSRSVAAVSSTATSNAATIAIDDNGDDDDDDNDDDALVQTKKAAKTSGGALDARVAEFVSYLYAEATGALTKVVQVEITSRGMKTPLGVLSPSQLDKGENVLDRIEVELRSGSASTSKLQALSSEFYTKIPHKMPSSAAAVRMMTIDDDHKVKEKRDLLQLMRDMLGVTTAGAASAAAAAAAGDAATKAASAVQSQYEALGCDIAALDTDGDEFNAVLEYLRRHRTSADHKNFTATKTDVVENSIGKAGKPPKTDWFTKNVYRVYRLRREVEHADYNGGAVGNEHHLFHASRISNWVGILSRGLLLPAAVTKLGIRRTDFGWLGAGIYFGAEWDTSEQYCTPGSHGTGCMLVARVALGKIQDNTQQDGSITSPKAGFNSIHGDPTKKDTQFDDHEYCVYEQNQHLMSYLVQFRPSDKAGTAL
jgi:poly [ADP-ribose] polymerase